MDDAISRDSVTSSTSEEFVVVNGEPKLKVAANVADISEEIASAAKNMDAKSMELSGGGEGGDGSCENVMPTSQSVNALSSNSIFENYPEASGEDDYTGAGRSFGFRPI